MAAISRISFSSMRQVFTGPPWWPKSIFILPSGSVERDRRLVLVTISNLPDGRYYLAIITTQP
jgi:hypothetical protein